MKDGRDAVATDSVAIIGMACRFPGASNITQFWSNLVNGVDSISRLSAADLVAGGFDPAVLDDPFFVPAAGMIGEADGFDAAFFGFNPREAALIDPQHRVFMECAWHAFEDAGYDPDRCPARIGVFAGTGATEHLFHLYGAAEVDQRADGVMLITSNDKDYLATRLSYKFNLRGPSVTVQTACSTSLVAVAMGMTSLLTYQCDMVLAGGVSLKVPEQSGYWHQPGGIQSPDGHCRSFDADAAGTVFTNGAGAVILKRLSDAIADRDHIYAVVKGAAVNNDGGRKLGYTAPSADGQADVMLEAYALADVSPDTLSYVEAHGTATRLGDPIEFESLSKAFRAHTDRKQFCALGSVKSNIGHTDIAAGVAGLIKTALALEHGMLPPNPHYRKPNPAIDFASSPFFVNDRLLPWPRTEQPRRAAVTSFGIGGTNAHLVLEEAPPPPITEARRDWKLMTISAATETALQAQTAALAQHLRQTDCDLDDLCFTLQLGRRVGAHRSVILCRNREEALAALEGEDNSRVHSSRLGRQQAPVAFMFPGQGSQYPGMGADLYRDEPVFRDSVDECARLLMPHLGLDLRTVLYPAGEDEASAKLALQQTHLTQPALFVISVAMARLWMAWGIKPEMMIGHSIGEYVAATLAGVFSLEDALSLVAARGRLMQDLPTGAMLAVMLPEDQVEAFVGQDICLAAVNSPSLCVLSGAADSITNLEQQLDRDGVACRRLATSHAFHSAMMDPILAPFAELVARARPKPPRIPFLSNVTGQAITDAEATDAEYWARHIRQPVLFSTGMRSLLASELILIEVGPGRSLTTAARHHDELPPGKPLIGSMPPADDPISGTEYAASSLSDLWAAGAPIDWPEFHRGEQLCRTPLPHYPFERRRHWIEASATMPNSNRLPAGQGRNGDLADWFYLPSWTRTIPADLLPAIPPGELRECWLIFLDDCGIGRRLAERLAKARIDFITVRPGPAQELLRTDDAAWRIDPVVADHYRSLVEELQRAGRRPTRIAHLWNCIAELPDPPPVDTASSPEDIFGSLLFLFQELIKVGWTTSLSVCVFSNGLQYVNGDRLWAPEKALLLGPCRVFPQEYPKLRCRSVDVVLPTADTDWETLTGQIFDELNARIDDAVIAYRGNHRWRQGYQRVRVEHPDSARRLRQNGTYLITGGLGGLGLTLAGFLATEVQANLVLVSRSGLPDEGGWTSWIDSHGIDDPVSVQIGKVKALRQAGATVMVCAADVGNIDSMRSVLDAAAQRFGAIHGVLHTAGVAGGGLLPLKTREMAERILRPKVSGTLTLAALLDKTPLDFFMLFSSITAIYGDVGQVDYCAANAFLDAYAQFRRSRGDKTFISVNWGTWDDLGMAMASTAATVEPGQKPNPPHPLLHRQVRKGSADVFTTRLDPAHHWPLGAHKIGGMPTLVGTTYLELATAAARCLVPDGALELRNVYFMAPFVSDGSQAELVLDLRQEGTASSDALDFTFRSGGSRGDELEHAIGQVRAFHAPAPAPQDIEQLRRRCDRWIDERPFARAEDAESISFGPQWDCLAGVHVGAGEALARIESPAACAADSDGFSLHPALLDVATVFAHRYLSEDELFLPLTYKRLVIHRPLPRVFYSHARYDEAGGSEFLSIDLSLLDEEGVVLAEIEGYTLKRVPRDFRVRGPAAGRTPRLVEDDAASRTFNINIRPIEGVEVFQRCLSLRSAAQVVIDPQDLWRRLADSLPDADIDTAADEVAAPKRQSLHPRPALKVAYRAPTNEVEEILAEIWQRCLGIESVGVDDNFIDLGGDSLLAVRVIAQVRKHLEIEITVTSFYQTPTISAVGNLVVAKIAELADEDTLAAMHSEIEQMPEEQVSVAAQ